MIENQRFIVVKGNKKYNRRAIQCPDSLTARKALIERLNFAIANDFKHISRDSVITWVAEQTGIKRASILDYCWHPYKRDCQGGQGPFPHFRELVSMIRENRSRADLKDLGRNF